MIGWPFNQPGTGAPGSGTPRMNASSGQQFSYEQLILEHATGAEMERLRRMSEAQDAYYSRFPMPLLPRPNKPNDNLVIGYCRLLVDAGAAFLMGNDVSFQIDETKKTAEEDWLEKIWKKSRKMTLLNNAAVNGGIYGHVFLRVMLPRRPGELPRVQLLDPMYVNVRWSPDDLDDVQWYHVSFPYVDRESKARQRRLRFEREDNGTWLLVEEERHPDATNWEESQRQAWPYQFAPIFHCQNLPAPNDFWGVADLEPDVIALNNAINFTISNLRRMIRYHGHPRTIGSGFTKQQIQVDVDETMILPNPDAKLWNLEMGGSPGVSLEYWRRLEDALFFESRMPRIAIGSLEGVGGLAGVALQIMYQPLLNKTESKRRLYGELLEELNRALLVIGGHRREDDDSLTIKTEWQEILPRDVAAERAGYAQEQQMGIVSVETISGKLGYDYQQEQERLKAEKEAGVGPAGAQHMQMQAQQQTQQQAQQQKEQGQGQEPAEPAVAEPEEPAPPEPKE